MDNWKTKQKIIVQIVSLFISIGLWLYVTNTEKETACYLAQDLRLNGFVVETDMMNKSLKAQFKSVDRFNSKYFIVLNDEDLAKNMIRVKDNKTKEEKLVEINDLIDYLDMNM